MALKIWTDHEKQRRLKIVRLKTLEKFGMSSYIVTVQPLIQPFKSDGQWINIDNKRFYKWYQAKKHLLEISSDSLSWS